MQRRSEAGEKPAGLSTQLSEMLRPTPSIQLGDRYFEVRPPHHVWMVGKIYTPQGCALEHVLLDRCGKFPASKLVAANALMDESMFRPDRRDSFSISQQKKSRRRITDPTS